MFIGHFAVGFASKRIAPRASLAPLFAAPLFLDLLWPVLLLVGVERVSINAQSTNPFLAATFTSYPWSHSLVMSLVWAVLFGGTYYGFARYGRGAWVMALAVVSHWVLDYLTHVPDLPLAPGGGPVLGLGLWRAPGAALAVEAVMFIAGVWLYTTGTVARDRIGRFAWWTLVTICVAAYGGSLVSPPPSSVTELGWMGIAGSAVFIGLAWWADRHRTARGA